MPKITFDIDDGPILFVSTTKEDFSDMQAEVPFGTLERWREAEEAFTLVQAEMWDILRAYRDSQEKGKQAKLDAQTDAIAEEASK